MYRLLIVDDEPVITDGLYELFKVGIGYELDLYKAYSGDEAIDWLNRTRVDIVLSDIRMPGMDGLQLLEKIKQNWPECKVVFLTGYNEFEYVYKAIQFRAVNYLLKTEGHPKIIEAVKKSIDEIEEARKLQYLAGQAKEFSDQAEYLLQRDFFIQMLQSGGSEIFTDQQPGIAGVPMATKHPVMLLLGRTSEQEAGGLYSERIREANMVRLVSEGYFRNTVSSFCIHVTTNEFLWFIQPDNVEALDREDLLPAWEKTDLFINGTLEVIQDVCVKTLNRKISFVFGNNAVPWAEAGREYDKLRQIYDRHIGDAGREIIILKRDYIEHETSENAILLKIQNFIDENLSRDVSLVRLAEVVHFNPTYLSRLFKLKKGITLSDYIDDLRIEKANRYLASGELKVHEIAELVGYESSTNFGRFYKKKTGITPQEYRDSVLNRNG
jgi:two-component system response regulator YesN